MKQVAYSTQDAAGCNIVSILRDKFNIGDDLIVESDDYMTDILELGSGKPDVCLVASRHRSESNQKTLTAHVTGNYGAAELGGNAGELALAPALYLSEALLKLIEYGSDLDYEISLEVTHHGPTNLEFPLVFIEVGSTLEQWNDTEACRVVAKVIYDLMKNDPVKKKVAIGFGGPHYAPNFIPVLSKVALGHIIPKYAAESISKEMILQMIEKTVPKPELALIDWKGLKGADRRNLIEILEKIGLQWRKTSEFK